jgi:hypothetical protein
LLPDVLRDDATGVPCRVDGKLETAWSGAEADHRTTASLEHDH